MDTWTSDPAQNRRRRPRLLHDLGSARNIDRKTGENRRTSLGDRRQFRNDEERTRPRSQRNALLAWLAPSRLAGHARFRHDGGDPRSRQYDGAAPKNDAAQCEDAQSDAALTSPSLIRWSMQEIRRIATRSLEDESNQTSSSPGPSGEEHIKPMQSALILNRNCNARLRDSSIRSTSRFL